MDCCDQDQEIMVSRQKGKEQKMNLDYEENDVNIKDKFGKKTLFFYDDILGTFQYAPGHPMKPFRVTMTDELVRAYEMYPYMDIYDINFNQGYLKESISQILTRFHSDDYIELISQVTPENKQIFEDQLYRYNFGDDCPVIDRLYEYCGIYSSASVVGADLLYKGGFDTVINWSGGLHHAKQSEASGFCYVNDVVLAILQMLNYYQRVLYIDIDIHHGDGVEEAFYTTDRVMTCSFHKFKDYFPGTGNINDIGLENGKYHAVNFPLNQGLDDESFEMIFRPVIGKIMEQFKPEAVLLQCGADSLSGDRLGCFNMSIKGHGECIKFVKSFNLPLMLVGGGGYTLRNVPRCWTYETSLCLNLNISNQMPDNLYNEYFAPEYKLHLPISNMENQNCKPYLQNITNQILSNLKQVSPTSIQIDNLSDENKFLNIDYQDVINKLQEERQDYNNQ